MKICIIGTGYVGLVSGSCFADLGNNVLCVDKIKEKIDMVDIFRAKDFIFNLTKEVIEIKAEVLWTQEGITHEEAANLGRSAGLVVVMDECPKKILEDWNCVSKILTQKL